MIYEGVFRKPRIKTNKILSQFSNKFGGDVINVSGSSDYDKNCGIIDYYFGNFDKGSRYKEYFPNAKSYTISNYPNDQTKYDLENDEMIFLDLEDDITQDLRNRYDTVFCHTVLEHVFDVGTSFKNLALLSKDILIVVVPQFQQIHDFRRGYADYWRFTPFSLDKLFELNNLTVLYRATTYGFSESMYLFYIGSKHPENWKSVFKEVEPLNEYISSKNDGSTFTKLANLHLNIDNVIRKVIRKAGLNR